MDTNCFVFSSPSFLEISLKSKWKWHIFEILNKKKTVDDNYDYQENWAQCADERGLKLNLR